MVYSLEMTPLKLIVELSGILAADQFREARRQFGEAWGWPADETWHRFLVHGGPETPDRATAFFLHRHSFTRGWWAKPTLRAFEFTEARRSSSMLVAARSRFGRPNIHRRQRNPSDPTTDLGRRVSDCPGSSARPVAAEGSRVPGVESEVGSLIERSRCGCDDFLSLRDHVVRRLPGGRGHTLAQRPPGDSQKPHGQRVKLPRSVRSPRGTAFGSATGWLGSTDPNRRSLGR